MAIPLALWLLFVMVPSTSWSLCVTSHLSGMLLKRGTRGGTHSSRYGLNSTLFSPSARKREVLPHSPLSPRINVERCSHWLKRFRTHQVSWCQASLCLSGLLGAQLPLLGISCLCTRCPWLVCGRNKGSFHLRGTTWSNGADTALPLPTLLPA